MRTEGFHQFPAMDRVVFGRPAAQAIAEEAARLSANRVFLMVSATLNRTTDEIEKIRNVLGDRYAGTYDSMPQHTTRSACLEAAAQARAGDADLIVSVGGGSVIDAAKIVPMIIAHDMRQTSDFDPFVMTGAVSPFGEPPMRMIAVPSTLNGGEFNAGALVTDDVRQLKQIFFHPKMSPITIVLDPDLARHAPPLLWFGSGTRAMDHGIEALCAPNGNPLTDEVVLAGIRYLHDGMLATLADPGDIVARRTSQYGAWLSASGIQARVSMGASHGIGHVLGGTFGVPHYFCTPVMMPSVLRYNQPAVPQAQARLAQALRGEPGMDAGTALAAFTRKLGLPGSLKEVGIGEDSFAGIARIAINHRFVRANPQPIASEADVIDILKMAA